MLNNIFYFVLNMSIIGSFITLLLVIIRIAFGKWIQKNYIYPLWGIVLFRLLIPISIPSPYSLINMIHTKSISIFNQTKAIRPDLSILNTTQLVDEYYPLIYKSEGIEKIFTIASVVWIVGMLIFLILTIISYMKASSIISTSTLVLNRNAMLKKCKNQLKVKKEIRLYELSFIKTPIVSGIIKPRIVIPKDIPKKVLECILLHEMTHIKSKDNLWKLLSIIAVCIHWFNPFAWLMLSLFERDMEGACDVKVLKHLTNKKRKQYAHTLVELSSKQNIPFTAFGNTALKERLINIINYKRIPVAMMIITSLLCLFIALILLTNPII